MRRKPPLLFRIRRLFTVDGFALASVWAQLALLLGASAALILLFAPLVGSLETSIRIFLGDAEGYADTLGTRSVLAGLIELIVGLCVYGFVISVLCSSLATLLVEVRSGAFPARKRNHVILINENAKVFHILAEMNDRQSDIGRVLDVVLLFFDRGAVRRFEENVDRGDYPFLNILAKQGNPFRFETYERVGLLDALGVAILLDSRITPAFDADNHNLKILSVLLSRAEFRSALLERGRAMNPYKFSIELTGSVAAAEVARSVASVGREPLVSVINPADVVTRILARSIVDITYYKIFFEIFSFYGHEVYFVDPARFSADGLARGETFEDLHVRFREGILIGYSRAAERGFEVMLAPFGRRLGPDDWLILIARTEAEIAFDATLAHDAALRPRLTPPSEIASRRICMIGNRTGIDRLGDFLDEKSRMAFAEHVILRRNQADYFDRDLILDIRGKAFDHVIINLDDETALRLTLYIVSLVGPDDPFLERLITVVENPAHEEILNANLRYRNTILSEKLAAKYITQLVFQKNLDKIYQELTAPEGFEFNLYDAGLEFPHETLESLPRLKSALLNNGMLYIATVGEGRQVRIADPAPSGAQRLVVLSRGQV